MANGRKISPNLEKEILVRAAEGMSTREIAAWCGTEHGVTVSHTTVNDLLAKTREVRADVAAAVTREALRPHITSDLDRLEEIRVEIADARAKDQGISHRDRVSLARLEMDVISKRLELSGAGGREPEAVSIVSPEDVRRMAAQVLGESPND